MSRFHNIPLCSVSPTQLYLFRDDFSPKFVALFTLLLFLKSFHWLAEDRVDFMERSPTISAVFHLRVISLNLLLAFMDVQVSDSPSFFIFPK